MTDHPTRRTFLKTTGAAAAAVTLGVQGGNALQAAPRQFDISLAAWSLHRSTGEGAGKTPALEMPKLARHEFDIGGVELVNRMLGGSDKAYVDKFIKNAADNDVRILLIMIDGEGEVGSTDEAKRNDAVINHKRWVDIAADMGCHSVRMNWGGAPRDAMENAASLQGFVERSVKPLRAICDYGDSKKLNVIIENHGGPSSYPDAMEQLIKAVDHPRFGTLPDFGNFPKDAAGNYSIDIYDAIDRLMKHAKAVSAKCYDFDETTGLETKLDFERLIQLVVDKHGYHSWIGIEYEGNRLSESDGIKAAKKLLDKLKA